MKKEWTDSVLDVVENFFGEATGQDITSLLEKINYDFYKTVKTPVLDFVQNDSIILETGKFMISNPELCFGRFKGQQWNYFVSTADDAADTDVRYSMAA